MTTPKVQLKPFARGPHTTAGDALSNADLLVSPDLTLLAPAAEPVSLGVPPVAPDLIRSVEIGWRVRSLRARSGQLWRNPLTTKPRTRWRVGWTHITCEENAALVEFFGAAQGTYGDAFAFDIEPDEGSGVVRVRLLAAPVGEWTDEGVYRWGPFDCEEVYG